MSEVSKARSRLGVATRLHESPEEIAEARRDLAEAKIAAFIRKALAASPRLTPEQVGHITSLLRGGDAA